MTLFLDTNILVDFLYEREPFSKDALNLFKRANKGYELWTSDNSITTCFYILDSLTNTATAKTQIGLLLKYISIEPTTKQVLQQALEVDFKDYEDGVQYCTALKNGNIDAIITRNKKDFKNSQIPVLSSDEIDFQ